MDSVSEDEQLNHLTHTADLSGPPRNVASAHQDDVALGDVAAVRQDRKDGRWVEQPINHMDDPVGGHNVSTLQMNALLT